jgi:hypothetical protein
MINVDIIEDAAELQNFWRDPFKQWYAAGLPCFTQKAKSNYKQVLVKFKTKEARAEFAEKLNYKLTLKTPAVYWPDRPNEANTTKRYVLEDKNEPHLPRYPIYIISKGRWETRHTSKALESMGVPYYIAVEPQEYDAYCSVIDPAKVLKLPFSNHGKGSGPARNWCWEHSMENGFSRHWLMDDNIGEFWRLHQNKRYRVQEGGSIFSSNEDFVDRYENIALASLHYKFFAVEGERYPPYILNTRCMSCILIQNDIGIRWRGRYNEDVDLSIRAMKEGYCTMLFYHALCGKLGTGTVKGGNTTEIYENYANDSAMKKSQMLYEQHPDCVELVERYGRIHHQMKLDKMMNKYGLPARQNVPILIKGVEMKNKVDNYGMQLAEKWNTEDQFINPDFSVLRYPEGRLNGHE